MLQAALAATQILESRQVLRPMWISTVVDHLALPLKWEGWALKWQDSHYLLVAMEEKIGGKI